MIALLLALSCVLPVEHELYIEERPCIQRQRLDVDLGMEPLWWTVEVRRGRNLWERMVPQPVERTDNWGGWPVGNPREAVMYRRGTVVTFHCGYPWEPMAGPMIDGHHPGGATRYRLTWEATTGATGAE